MCHRVEVVVVVVLLLAGCGMAAAGQARPPVERPTPRDWDQWQPKKDDSDGRLGAVVSVSEGEVRLEELEARLSEATGVDLGAEESLRPQRLMVFAKGESLSGVMVALGDLYGGYWVFRREQRPGDRAYVLVEFASATEFIDKWANDFLRELTGQTLAERNEALMRRLRQYREALPLRPEEVLARYEQSDPWLCVEVLRPDTRPLVAFVAGIGQEQMRALTEEGRVVLSGSEVAPEAMGLLREREAAPELWDAEIGTTEDIRGAYFGKGEAKAGGPEGRVVRLLWNAGQVELQFLGPKTGHQMVVVTVPPAPPEEARQELVRLGLVEATPERTKAMEEERAAWEKEQEAHDWEGMFPDTWFGTESETAADDPRLAMKVRPEVAPDAEVKVSYLLGKVAEQCGLLVVADVVPEERSTCRLESVRWVEGGGGGEIELGQVLDALRCQNEVVWKLRGRRLVVMRDEPRIGEGGEAMTVEEWLVKHHPVLANLIFEIASGLAALGTVH